MRRSQLWIVFSMLAGMLVAAANAQDKKTTPKDEPKKVETKPDAKTDPKTEPKKEVKTEPKTEPKKEVKVEAAPLNWKFEANKPFYQKLVTITEQSIKVMGLDVVQKQEQTFFFKFTPMNKEGDTWLIKQEIEGVIMKIDIAGNPVSFDSTQENPASGGNTALSEFFKAVKGGSFTLHLNTKTMKVDKVEGRQVFLAKLSTANQQLEPLLSKILSEDALRQMADPTFGVLPPAGKKVGDTWDVSTSLNLGPIGSYANKYTYTWKGPDPANKDLEIINVANNLSFSPPTESDPNLPFKIKTGSTITTKPEKEPGKIVFNTKTGRIESSNVKLTISGDLMIEIGGNLTKVELTQNQTTTVAGSESSLLPGTDPKKK